MAHASKIEKVDGRRLRSQDSRQRIVKAMLSLVGEGVMSPTAEQVSETANVGIRTVFRHFRDMESLYREISEELEKEVLPFFDVDVDSDAPDPIETIVQRKAVLYEKISPYKICGSLHRHRSVFLRADNDRMVKAERRFLERFTKTHFQVDRIAFAALENILSFEFWRRLREDQSLSVSKSSEVVLRAARAIFEQNK
jgi:AcrR family transcriptional regulator